MARIDKLLEAEAVAAEMAEADQDSAVRTDVRITRGHSAQRRCAVTPQTHRRLRVEDYTSDPEVAGSNPAPATNFRRGTYGFRA
jgi:hypothetical protein